MTRRCNPSVLFLCLALGASAAYGQGNCSIQTILGTYAFNFTGSSTILTGVAPDKQDPLHWTALHAPIAGVGIFTVKSLFPRTGGTADGSYWLLAGRLDLGHDPLQPTPLHATITVNPDCSGTMDYTFGPYPVSEQFLILDKGNEIRSVAVKTAVETSTWLTTARRLGGACSQATIAGSSYIFACRPLTTLDPTTTFASAILIRGGTVAPNGSWSGTFTIKIGPVVVPDAPFTGTLKVNSDCTAEGSMVVPGVGTSLARGVFFNDGKEGYWLPMAGTGQPWNYCEIKQIGNR
jgi:hypothetical protein